MATFLSYKSRFFVTKFPARAIGNESKKGTNFGDILRTKWSKKDHNPAWKSELKIKRARFKRGY